jgi:ribosome-binding factor A
MSHRIEQVNELIRSELGSLLLSEMEWPAGCLVTILRVETSKDLRHAKVWVSVMPAYLLSKAMERLKKNAGHLQFELNKRLSLKPLPRIRFVVDKTEEQAGEIEQLLDRISQ